MATKATAAKRRDEALDATFQALSDPTRRAILARLAEGPAPVGELAAPFDISAPAISRHLRVLEDAGLVAREKVRQQRIIRLEPKRLKEASEWVDRYRRFWEAQLDALGAYLERTNDEGERDGDATDKRG